MFPKTTSMALLGALFGMPFFSSPVQAQRDDLDFAPVISAFNDSGVKLFNQLKEEGKNLVLSPSSIGIALSMTRSGARGKTQEEMTRVLGHSNTADQVDAMSEALMNRLSRTQGDVRLTLANALCLTKVGGLVGPPFKKRLNENYGAEIFTGNDPAVINDWVKKKTQGQIEKILERLDENSVCVLLNSIHFSGTWQKKFEVERTKEGEFAISKEKKVKVPLMAKAPVLPVISADLYKATVLQYKDASLGLILILPHEMDGLGKVEEDLDGPKIVEMIKTFDHGFELIKKADREELPKLPPGLAIGRVALAIPKFKIATHSDLIPALKKCGLNLPFGSNADFAGIADQANPGDLYLSQIQHRAQLEIDENGTLASAATAAEVAVRGGSSSKLLFDHPFLFLLVDMKLRAVHFMGRVVDPS